MRYLFYFVHPAKFHLFRITINKLKEKHSVDIVINSKDVLENLISKEGWVYTNIFPKGRNVSKKPSVIKSGLKFILTIIRLEKYLFDKEKYDVFVTDDALVVNGWIRKIPTYIFNDNDIDTISINKILFYFAKFVISPEATNLGKFSYKKKAFKGNKALAHLNPNYFIPVALKIVEYGFKIKKYILIRLALLNATHDKDDNRGITDEQLSNIIDLFNGKYEIIILTERIIDKKYKKYLYRGEPEQLNNFIKYAKLVISDSGTIATEAAMLGTPNILINKIAKNISVHMELERAGLQYYFDDCKSSKQTILKLLQDEKLENIWADNLNNYLENCDDFNTFLKNLLESGSE